MRYQNSVQFSPKLYMRSGLDRGQGEYKNDVVSKKMQ
jgi:hypothetical protein